MRLVVPFLYVYLLESSESEAALASAQGGPSPESLAHRREGRDGEEREQSGRKERAMVDGQGKASQESAANNGQPASERAISLCLCLFLPFSVLFSPLLSSLCEL